MYFRSALTFLGVAWLASAAPLNINLGAYSPALVVGDGAISFAGAEGAEGAGGAAEAVLGAQPVEGAQVAEGAQTVDGVGNPEQATGGEAESAEEQTPVTAQDTTLLQGMGKQRLPRD